MAPLTPQPSTFQGCFWLRDLCIPSSGSEMDKCDQACDSHVEFLKIRGTILGGAGCKDHGILGLYIGFPHLWQQI